MHVLDILITYHQMSATGVLTLQHADITKDVLFKNGEVIFVHSNQREESLGYLLTEEGVISNDQYQELLKELAVSKKMMGELIIQKGYLSPGEVVQKLTEQAVTKLRNTLSAREFGFTFREDLPNNVLELDVPFFRTLLEGLIKYYNVARYREEGDFRRQAILLLTSQGKDILPKLQLKPSEARLVHSIDGSLTIGQFIEKARDKRVATALVYLLEHMELIESEERGDASQVPDAAPPSQHEPAAPEQPATTNVTTPAETAPPPVAGSGNQMYQKLLSFDRVNYFSFLEVKKNDPSSKIERQYHGFIKEFQLGNIEAAFSNNDKAYALQLLDKFTRAYVILTDRDKKEQYLAELGGQEAHRDEKAETLLNAEIEYCKAVELLRFQSLPEAFAAARAAAEKNPNEPEYVVLQAEIQMKLQLKTDDDLNSEPLDLLRKVVTNRPQYYRTYLQMGYYYKIKKKMDKAASFFQKALDHKTDCHEAERELRLIDLRGSKKSSLLGAFRKK